ncbi:MULTISPECIES: TetR family transcriptional regulator [Actinoalloteichus]|uniref:Transcriptional regulator, TetR family n=1 Tax=Actinoalloteichus fjordicus TaxID=1612552 RepID=A0AAC9L8V8_9PSEU|nr:MULTISPECIES: TetR family transcriptional regulator [Actinoalloteichus]APU13242.1 transcriptional regulator, TetR family [Actinoalloteichus fjordicus]APU19193.1 transcriptional regulator, TetR family [Actinoalloteichus sp. GBA129-24]
MTTSRDTGPGLRERKKQQTRETLSWAALRLTVERGLDAVLIEDIAAEAGVSPRTFNNYFEGKAEAVVWRHFDRAARMADLLRERPAEEPLWDAVIHAVHAVHAHAGDEQRSPDPEWTAGVALLVGEPALQGAFLKASAAADRERALAIGERTGTDPDKDMYPTLVSAAIGSAIDVATRHWLRADPPVPLGGLLRAALAEITAGLPEPGR